MWIIIRDYLTADGEDLNRVGVRSNNYNEERFAKADTIPIRLLDDDREVYYEGRATRKRILDSSEEYAFEPLDWAMNFYNDEWQTL